MNGKSIMGKSTSRWHSYTTTVTAGKWSEIIHYLDNLDIKFNSKLIRTYKIGIGIQISYEIKARVKEEDVLALILTIPDVKWTKKN